MIDSQIGPYRILRLLGEGGMGAVYEAVNESIERRVAIKVLRSEYAQKEDVVGRFFNEARAVNRIAHPSLVQIHEQGSLEDGTAYIVMEYLDGQTLSERLKQVGGRLPVMTAVRIAWQLGAGLAAAHHKGIVHRDLNPANVMLIADPFGPGGERVKILDFGIATLFAYGKQGGPEDQLIMGTPMYMSPEQCHGVDAADEKTDVYSLGTVLFEMLAGRPPFVGDAATDLVGMHLFRAPPSLAELAPDVPAELGAFTEQLLLKDPTQRPSMQEVAQHLAQFAAADAAGSTSKSSSMMAAVPAPISASAPASAPIVMPMPMMIPMPMPAPGSMQLPVMMPAPMPMPQTPHLPPRSWGRLIASGLAGCVAAAGLLILARELPRVAALRQAQTVPTPAKVAPPATPPPPVVHKPADATVRKPPRPLSVKLPPLRTLAVAPIHPPQSAPPGPVAPKPPASNPATDAVLSNAQREYLMKNYAKAIELARSVAAQSPLRAWRVIGSSACGLKDSKLLRESYFKLDQAGRQYLYFVCQRSGISTEALFGGAKN